MRESNKKGVWGKAISIGGREEQQDTVNIFSKSDSTLLVVADGMGGHSGGRKASALMVEAAQKVFFSAVHIANGEIFFDQVIRVGYEAIREYGTAEGISPHTTVVMLLVQNGVAEWAHVGDSRLLRFKRGQYTDRTRDHSVVELLVHSGEISEAEMATHPDQNKLLRSIGSGTPPKASYGKTGIEAGDAFLLCSDGLWETVSPDEMAAQIYHKTAQEAADYLVGMAQTRGGKAGDNVSCALWINPIEQPPAPAKKPERRVVTAQRQEPINIEKPSQNGKNNAKMIIMLLSGVLIGIFIFLFVPNVSQEIIRLKNAVTAIFDGNDVPESTENIPTIAADSLQTDSSGLENGPRTTLPDSMATPLLNDSLRAPEQSAADSNAFDTPALPDSTINRKEDAEQDNS